MTKPLGADERAAAIVHLEAAEQMVFDLCSGRKRWTMRVPAEELNDSDLVIMAALSDLRELLGIGPRLRAEPLPGTEVPRP